MKYIQKRWKQISSVLGYLIAGVSIAYGMPTDPGTIIGVLNAIALFHLDESKPASVV